MFPPYPGRRCALPWADMFWAFQADSLINARLQPRIQPLQILRHEMPVFA